MLKHGFSETVRRNTGNVEHLDRRVFCQFHGWVYVTGNPEIWDKHIDCDKQLSSGNTFQQPKTMAKAA